MLRVKVQISAKRKTHFSVHDASNETDSLLEETY